MLLTENDIAIRNKRNGMLIKALTTPSVAEYPETTHSQVALPVLLRLNSLDLDDLANKSTPFLVMNARRLALALTQMPEEQPIALKMFLISALDSFSSLLEGVSVPVELPGPIILPNLGIRAGNDGDQVLQIRLASDDTLEVVTPFKTSLLKLDVSPESARLRRSSVSAAPFIKVLGERSPQLYEGDYLGEIQSDIDSTNFMTCLVDRALSLIRRTSIASYESVLSICRWIVPIASTSTDVHRSFTSPRLPGVVFASINTDDLGMAEAIVHETAHSELNMLLEVEELLPDCTDATFYSPWRPDPRPISGIFHALYVFGRVLTLLQGVPTAVPQFATAARDRGNLIAHRIVVGHAQISGILVNSRAKAIIDQALSVANQYLANNCAVADRTPEVILKHMSNWRARHPLLVMS